jgi:hypothetical protein
LATAAVLIILHVVKTFRNIYSYLLVLLFLVPATGFYYTRHSCLKSGKVQFVLDGDHSCCADIERTVHDPVNQENSCCDMEFTSQANEGSMSSSQTSSLDCCVNEGNYLKSEDEYTFPGSVEMPNIEFILTAAIPPIALLPVLHQTIEENAHSPPFIFSSVDILHKHSVLII